MPDNTHCLPARWSQSCVVIQRLCSLLNCSLEMSLFPHLNVRTGKASCAYGQGSGECVAKELSDPDGECADCYYPYLAH